MSASELGRQERLIDVLAAREIAVLIVTDPANVRYLTGYVGSNGVAVVSAGARCLVTDSRYAVSAREQVRGAEVIIGTRDLLSMVASRAVEASAGGVIGVEADDLTIARYARLQDLLGGAPTTTTNGLIEDLRQIKDAGEVAAMREAAAVVDRALGSVLERGIVGRTERAVAFSLYEAVLAEGGQDLSFSTIVASGPRGARPHHVPGNDVIPEGTLVVIDMGAVVDGYCSDMTRTVATGPLTPRLEEIYAVCLAAEEAALAAAAPDMAAVDLDAIARASIGAAGYGEAFGHGLGHGVGLVIHERPGVRPESADALRSGMAITIEPGIYLEGEGGVRIEDLIVLGSDGNEVLSHFPKELRIVA